MSPITASDLGKPNPCPSDPVEAYLDLWERSDESPHLSEFLALWPGLTTEQLAELLLIDQGHRWARGGAPSADEYLRDFPAVADNPEFAADLVYGEYRARCPAGSPALAAELLQRFPHLKTQLGAQFEFLELLRESEAELPGGGAGTSTARELAFLGTVAPSPAVSSAALAPLPFEDYRLEQRLGEGAMGQVFRATQLSLNRLVAVKLLGSQGQRSPQLVDRFLREARAVAALRHPNIVQVYGVGRAHENGYFIVMDLVDGGDLQRRLADGPLPVAEAAKIGIEVARALDHSHARGVVHRDLKPSNVMLDTDGRVIVTDFGLAKSLAGPDAAMSSPGDIIGTPQYMAPEQADPRWGDVGPRTDVYGLGGLLFALLTGQPPVTGSTRIEVLCKVASSGETPVVRKLRPEVPASLEAICSKCLRKRPADRYASAREVEDALRACLDGVDCPPSQVGPIGHRRERRIWSRRPAQWLVIGVAVAISFALYLSFWLRRGDVAGNVDRERLIARKSDDTKSGQPVEVQWTIDVFRGKHRDRRQRITDSPAPLFTGDSLRLEFAFSRPVHAHVCWVSADGSLSTLYPSDLGEDAPVTHIAIPPAPDDGLPVVGKAGTEVGVVFLRDRSSTGSRTAIAGWPPPTGFPPLRDAALLIRNFQPYPVRPAEDAGKPGMALLAQSEARQRLEGDSRALDQAEPLIDDSATRAITEWLGRLPRELGAVECFAVRHLDSPTAGSQ